MDKDHLRIVDCNSLTVQYKEEEEEKDSVRVFLYLKTLLRNKLYPLLREKFQLQSGFDMQKSLIPYHRDMYPYLLTGGRA
jgi:hypothetical protein